MQMTWLSRLETIADTLQVLVSTVYDAEAASIAISQLDNLLDLGVSLALSDVVKDHLGQPIFTSRSSAHDRDHQGLA